MKSYLLSFVFSILYVFVYSQSTKDLFSLPGLKIGLVYVDTYFNDRISNQSVLYERDSIANGDTIVVYTKVVDPTRKFYYGIKGKQVYIWDYELSQLIYDFGLNIGDIFNRMEVVEKTTITLSDGYQRQYLKLRDIYHNYEEEWIEGLGNVVNGLTKQEYIHNYHLHFSCAKTGEMTLLDVENPYLSCDTAFCVHSAARFDFEREGKEVRFINKSIYQNVNNWDFGDGDHSNDNNPTYSFDTPGCKTITLMTSSGCGDTSIYIKNIDYCLLGDWQLEKKLNNHGYSEDVILIDENVMWSKRGNRFLLSTDGGESFENRIPNVPLREFLVRDYFFKDSLGVIMYFAPRLSNNILIYTTKNYGRNWSKSFEGASKSYNHRLSSNGSTIFIHFKNITNQFFVSFDFGKTWQNCLIPVQFDVDKIFVDDDGFLSVIEKDFGEGSEDIHNLYFSDNKAFDWEEVILPKYIYSSISSSGVAVLFTSDYEAVTFKDNFSSYQTVTWPVHLEDIRNVLFKNEFEGFLSLKSGHPVFFTNDGGMSWSSQNCTSLVIPYLKYDQTSEIYGFNGIEIFRFHEISVDPSCNFGSHTNEGQQIRLNLYPNPILSGSTLFIESELENGFIIEIFNMNGQKIYESVCSQNSYQFNLTDVMPSQLIVKVIDKQSGVCSVKKLIVH